MPKKALGRGLGQLLFARPTAPGGALLTGSKAKDPAELGPGLRVLVRERNGDAPSGEANGSVASKGSWAVVKISLLVADVVLVALLVLWQSSTTNRMGALEALTCVIAAGLGAWLAGLAAWLHFNQAALRKNQGG